MKQNGHCVYGFWDSKTSDPQRLLLNISYKINLKKSDK